MLHASSKTKLWSWEITPVGCYTEVYTFHVFNVMLSSLMSLSASYIFNVACYKRELYI